MLSLHELWSIKKEKIDEFYSLNKKKYINHTSELPHVRMILDTYDDGTLIQSEREIVENQVFMNLLRAQILPHNQRLTSALYNTDSLLSRTNLSLTEAEFANVAKDKQIHMKQHNSKQEHIDLFEETKVNLTEHQDYGMKLCYIKDGKWFDILKFISCIEGYSLEELKIDIKKENYKHDPKLKQLKKLIENDFFIGSIFHLRCNNHDFKHLSNKIPLIYGTKIIDFSDCKINDLDEFHFKCINETNSTTIETIILNNNRLINLNCHFYKGTTTLLLEKNPFIIFKMTSHFPHTIKRISLKECKLLSNINVTGLDFLNLSDTNIHELDETNISSPMENLIISGSKTKILTLIGLTLFHFQLGKFHQVKVIIKSCKIKRLISIDNKFLESVILRKSNPVEIRGISTEKIII